MGSRRANIEQWQAIDIDADFGQRNANRLRVQQRGLHGGNGGQPVKLRKAIARRKLRPDRRLHPLNAPALLIHHDRHIIAAMQRSQTICQRADLILAFEIPAKQDVPGRIRLAKKAALRVGQFQPG